MTEGGMIEIKPDRHVERHYYRISGLAIAVEAMGGEKPLSTLPGFALAKALVEKELAEARCDYSRAVYQCAARAGHNIAEIGAMFAAIKDNKLVIELKPSDLVDKAEAQVE